MPRARTKVRQCAGSTLQMGLPSCAQASRLAPAGGRRQAVCASAVALCGCHTRHASKTVTDLMNIGGKPVKSNSHCRGGALRLSRATYHASDSECRGGRGRGVCARVGGGGVFGGGGELGGRVAGGVRRGGRQRGVHGLRRGGGPGLGRDGGAGRQVCSSFQPKTRRESSNRVCSCVQHQVGLDRNQMEDQAERHAERCVCWGWIQSY